MIGEVIHSHSGVHRGWTLLFFFVAAFFVIVAVFLQNLHVAVFAVFPFILGIASLIVAEPPIEFEVTKEGLTFTLPTSVSVRYDAIQGLTAPTLQPGNNFAIQLYHPDGVIRIPAGLTVSSRALYEFLLDKLPPIASPDPTLVPAKLRTFVTEQVNLFGQEKVFVFHARPFPPINSYHRHIAYSRAAIAAGLGWVVCAGFLEAIDSNGAGWFAAGFALILMGLVCRFGFSRVSGSGRPPNWRESCLVVSPGGIALVQGSLQGRMRWDELRAIELPARHRFGLASHGEATRGVGLLVEGAYFIIADFYNRPLGQIHSHLRSYWGDQEAN